LFDWINVVAAAAPGRRSDYRLDGSVEYRGEETVDLRFRLVDESDATVIWSRDSENVRQGQRRRRAQTDLELSNAVVQPFRLIWARDLRAAVHMVGGDPRYVGMMDAAEVIKSFDPVASRIRDELENLDGRLPGLRRIRISLVVYAREYCSGSARVRAIRRRSIAHSRPRAKASSCARKAARAYTFMSAVLFYSARDRSRHRGGRAGIVLNPYDLLTVSLWRAACRLRPDRPKAWRCYATPGFWCDPAVLDSLLPVLGQTCVMSRRARYLQDN